MSGVSFPDFPGVVTTGRTAEEAIRKGSEALSFHVAGMGEDGDTLPLLRDLDALERDPGFHEDRQEPFSPWCRSICRPVRCG